MTGVAVIGAGPAGLMAAERLAADGHLVTIYDAMPSPARKFLLAGRGGLNITHSEDIAAFLQRYREAASHLEPLIRLFSPTAMREWCAALGEETFTGSSGRVFPRSFKTSPLLRAWLRRLDSQGVGLRTGHHWTGFDPAGSLRFVHAGTDVLIPAEATVLALGGASWPRLGSTGAWVPVLEAIGVSIAPLRPSNSGFETAWTDHLRERHAGEPLKRIALTFRGETVRGEAMITAAGLEGGAVYALSGPVREALQGHRPVTVILDLRPDMTTQALTERLSGGRKGDSLTNRLRKQAGLSPAAVGVLRDAVPALATLAPDGLATAIKAAPLTVTGLRPVDKAISTAGGVRWSELDGNMMLKQQPGIFCAGEMIDWEGPTGGYLLQACFATGAAAADGVSRWTRSPTGHPAG
jgi:uncharacterized flavoprotein (TIGR03862 family)